MTFDLVLCQIKRLQLARRSLGWEWDADADVDADADDRATFFFGAHT